MAGRDELIRTLLEEKGMSEGQMLCKKVAQEEFDLEHYHLNDLACTEEENPHSSQFAAKKMYSAWDVAGKAIDINGPTGMNPQLKCRRADEEADRAAKRRSIEDRQRRQAAEFSPTSAVDRKCKEAGVTPWQSLPKTKIMDAFGLDWAELQMLGVPYESRPNPYNARYKPMQLYKARDVARALLARDGRFA